MATTKATDDRVLLVLAFTAAGLCFITAVTVALIALLRPESDVNGSVRYLADIATTIIGALIGYVAGLRRGQAAEKKAEAAEVAEVEENARRAAPAASVVDD
jgi:hypothetical protein